MDHLFAKFVTLVVMATAYWLLFRNSRLAAIEAVGAYWRACDVHYVVRGRPRFFMGHPAYLYVIVDDGGSLYECKYELSVGLFARKKVGGGPWRRVVQRYKVRL